MNFTVIVNGKSHNITTESGKSILACLRQEGIVVNAFCAGNGTCKKCTVSHNGSIVLACQSIVNDGDTVELLSSNYVFNDSKKSYLSTRTCSFAIDIGTTTVSIALVNNNQEIVEIKSFVNPQVMYGADVISRIQFACEGKQSQMQQCLIDELNRHIKELKNDNKVEQVEKIIVSGNTTMLHILLGKDCTSLGQAPFTTQFTKSQTINAEDIGIDIDCSLITIDCISAFVGGDIVAGLHQLPIPTNGKYSLLIDLGTNAEIAIINNKQCMVTSAAAGPCFEGANISQGISCVEGAICSVKYIEDSFLCSTVNDKIAKGICGTGLIDAVAQMIKHNMIDEYGSLNGKEIKLTRDVKLTQQDIRQFQLAKSAVYSAVEVLLNKMNLTDMDIDKVYLSGGFSIALNIENAVISGLIEKSYQEKCVAINNSSLLGAIKFLQDNTISSVILDANYIDLASDIQFSEKFIENMLFKGINDEK